MTADLSHHQLNGYVDLSTLKIDATFSVHIPIIGTHQIAGVNGNLKEGVKVSFALSHVLSGSAKFYLKNKWLFLDLDAKVFGHNESISFHLIPLPCVPQIFRDLRARLLS